MEENKHKIEEAQEKFVSGINFQCYNSLKFAITLTQKLDFDTKHENTQELYSVTLWWHSKNFTQNRCINDT